MQLFRLAYYSKLRAVKNLDLIQNIIRVSQERNKADGVTGVLVLRGDYFFQVLEGGMTPVNQLYARLMKDPRHADLHLLLYEQVKDRLFKDWLMKSLEFTPAQGANLIAKYDLGGAHPYPIEKEMLHAFLFDLRHLSTPTV